MREMMKQHSDFEISMLRMQQQNINQLRGLDPFQLQQFQAMFLANPGPVRSIFRGLLG